jgi:hypothetical protein
LSEGKVGAEQAESDIYTKFHVLRQYGGIFLDTNILITRPLTGLRYGFSS